MLTDCMVQADTSEHFCLFAKYALSEKDSSVICGEGINPYNLK